jgi:hypothetical protein
MTAPFDVVIFQAGERGDFPPPAKAAADFVAMARMNPRAELTVCLAGFGDDPRELFDIPEAMAFLRAMVGSMGPLVSPAELKQIFDRFSYECRALMLLAAGVIRREQINITPR